MKVSRRRQITLPISLCEKFKVRAGDLVEFKETKKGVLLEFHPAEEEEEEDESWWLSPWWQEGHREALEDFREGRVAGPFKTAKELMDSVRKRTLG